MTLQAPSRQTPETHLRNQEKLARIPVKVIPTDNPTPKPAWIRIKASGGAEVSRVKKLLREQGLVTVCEEAACPNLSECFGHGTATFMILGDLCTRRCPFCDVAHGKPRPPDAAEPEHLATTVAKLQLNYVVITSVDRDDLRDGGAGHFAACIQALRQHTPDTRVEILVPDFRGRLDKALAALAQAPCDVFNHNLETVPRLYKQARPGADYRHSLTLLARFAKQHPGIPTKSGLMLGLGESLAEIKDVLNDLRAVGCQMLTIGQYLAPSNSHLPVARYYHPDEFAELKSHAEAQGFAQVASAPLVRSSYHADQQAKALWQNSAR
ncbi:MAG: lipoyl synthase [Methylococcales bacterium]|nr:lipoyl synthase [Methylococcales bacterium]